MEQGDQDARAEYSGGKREAGLKSARDVGECPGDDRSEALSGGENDRVRAAIPQDQAWEGKDRRAMDVTVVGTARQEPPKSAAEAKATAAEPETSSNCAPVATTASITPRARPPRSRSIGVPQRAPYLGEMRGWIGDATWKTLDHAAVEALAGGKV